MSSIEGEEGLGTRLYQNLASYPGDLYQTSDGKRALVYILSVHMQKDNIYTHAVSIYVTSG